MSKHQIPSDDVNHTKPIWKNPTSIIWAGVILAFVWGAVIFGVNIVISPADIDSQLPSLSHLDEGSNYPLDQVIRQVESLKRNQAATDGKLATLTHTIEFNAILLGTIVAFFGALVTILVLFITLRARHEAIVEARLEGQNAVRRTYDELQSSFDALREELTTLIDEKLRERSVEEPISLSDEEENRAERALLKPENERTARDWWAVAFLYVENKAFLKAGDAFLQCAKINLEEEELLQAIKSYMNAGISYDKCDEPMRSISTYETLVELGKGSANPDILAEVAKGWVNLGTVYTMDIEGWAKQPEKRISTYQDLIDWGKESEYEEVQKQVSAGWFNLGLTYTMEIDGWTPQPNARIETYQSLINWGKSINTLGVQESVAKSWVNLGTTYTMDLPNWTKQAEKRIQVYEEFIQWGKASENPEIQKCIAMGWVNLALTYSTEMDNWETNADKEVETYEALIKWGKNNPNLPVQEQVATAWFNLTSTYATDAQNWDKDIQKAISEYKAFIEWGEQIEHPSVAELVSMARSNLEELNSNR